jgi:hypothetical protein
MVVSDTNIMVLKLTKICHSIKKYKADSYTCYAGSKLS